MTGLAWNSTAACTFLLLVTWFPSAAGPSPSRREKDTLMLRALALQCSSCGSRDYREHLDEVLKDDWRCSCGFIAACATMQGSFPLHVATRC